MKLSLKDIIILLVGLSEKPIDKLHLKYETFVACKAFGIDAEIKDIEKAIEELEKEGLIERT